MIDQLKALKERNQQQKLAEVELELKCPHSEEGDSSMFYFPLATDHLSLDVKS